VRALGVAVLADTHMRQGSGRRLPPTADAVLGRADVILHAGDLVDEEVLAQLSARAPTHAVLGNNDAGLAGVLPASLQLVLAGVRVAMLHDSGPRRGREGRLRRLFPSADVVVFGHSHEPVDAVGVEEQRLFNPGSPTERRRQPSHTMGWLDLAGGRVLGHRIIEV
jgi:uncharacterized protein